ncbi:MAG: hypothetical protein K9G62_02450 [Alphaproteobacteria bacterium]|nr:hypothetical protein [Alphaproteobacteria bacterium]
MSEHYKIQLRALAKEAFIPDLVEFLKTVKELRIENENYEKKYEWLERIMERSKAAQMEELFEGMKEDEAAYQPREYRRDVRHKPMDPHGQNRFTGYIQRKF